MLENEVAPFTSSYACPQKRPQNCVSLSYLLAARENSHSSELLREHKPFKNASLSILLQNEISKDDEVRFFSTKVLIEMIILCAEIMVCLCLRYQDVLFVCVKQ